MCNSISTAAPSISNLYFPRLSDKESLCERIKGAFQWEKRANAAEKRPYFVHVRTQERFNNDPIFLVRLKFLFSPLAAALVTPIVILSNLVRISSALITYLSVDEVSWQDTAKKIVAAMKSLGSLWKLPILIISAQTVAILGLLSPVDNGVLTARRFIGLFERIYHGKINQPFYEMVRQKGPKPHYMAPCLQPTACIEVGKP